MTYDISTGLHLFKDGNAWCALGPTFRDLQQDRAGFGRSQQDAVDAWWAANKDDQAWRRLVPQKPPLGAFAQHGDNETQTIAALMGEMGRVIDAPMPKVYPV